MTPVTGWPPIIIMVATLLKPGGGSLSKPGSACDPPKGEVQVTDSIGGTEPGAPVQVGLRPPPEATTVKGLPNTGNTCYLATVVQLVAATTALREMVLQSEQEIGRILADCINWSSNPGASLKAFDLGVLAEALMGHRGQEDPMAALSRVVETIGLRDTTVDGPVLWGHREGLHLLCGQCGEVNESTNSSFEPLRVAVPSQRSGFSTLTLASLLEKAFEPCVEMRIACCSADPVSA